MRQLGLIFTLVAASMSAATIFTVTGSDGDGNVSGTADFTISGSDLFVAITNSEANPTAAGQLISDLKFPVLENGTTVLTSTGTLSSTITDDGGADPSNDGVTVLSDTFTSTTTNTTPARWQLAYESSQLNTACDSVGFCLNSLTGGSPEYMIIGPGPYTNANSSSHMVFTRHLPGP